MRKALITFIAIILVILALKLLHSIVPIKAGSLNPSASPAATMYTAQQIYNALVGTFNSSGITASSTGSALQISQCIITKINGGNCN